MLNFNRKDLLSRNLPRPLDFSRLILNPRKPGLNLVLSWLPERNTWKPDLWFLSSGRLPRHTRLLQEPLLRPARISVPAASPKVPEETPRSPRWKRAVLWYSCALLLFLHVFCCIWDSRSCYLLHLRFGELVVGYISYFGVFRSRMMDIGVYGAFACTWSCAEHGLKLGLHFGSKLGLHCNYVDR